MMLTDLADVLRDAGLDVAELPGWKTRGHGPMKAVLGATCHHTASGRGTGTTLGLATVRDGRPGLDGPLAHLYLNRAGKFYTVAAGLCYHAGISVLASQTNPYRIGIEALAAGDGWAQDWPAEQMEAYARGCHALADHYRFSFDQVLGHKETAKPKGRKVDPSFRVSMGTFRTIVRDAHKPAPPPVQEDIMAKLDPDDYDKIADRVWQRGQALTGQTPGGALHEVDLRTTGGSLPGILAEVRELSDSVDAKVAELLAAIQRLTPPPPPA